jgi:protocatechuate 3,4-dioxygenase beta subunit
MAKLAGYRRPYPGTQPQHLHPPYVSSIKRSPSKPLVYLPHTLSEVTGPLFDASLVEVKACDLTRQHQGEPLGERITVTGRVLDENGRPVRHTLVEIWQANAAGRYMHKVDQHNAPLDPNFSGGGRTLTDGEGRYKFITIRPGEYPWRNHYNAWRLVTQMYFPGDPLLPYDPIFNCTGDEKARNRLISIFDWETTVPDESVGYRFDIVLNGRESTPWEE